MGVICMLDMPSRLISLFSIAFLLLLVMVPSLLIVSSGGGGGDKETVPMLYAQTSTSMPSSQFHLSKGYVDGKTALFLATDSSDNNTSKSISDSVGYKVNYAPVLAEIPKEYVQQGYDFVNGVKGDGNFGFQIPVATSLPGDADYSPLVQLNFVKWNNNTQPTLLKSAEDIEKAQRDGDVQISKTGVIVNSPPIQIK
jgi:hypothetical protein